MLGEYAFALAVTAPIFMLANLRLRFVLASDHERTPFADFLKLRIILTGLAAVVAITIGFAVTTSIAAFGVVLAITAFKIAEAIGDIGLGLFQAREKMPLVARASWLLTAAILTVFSGTLIVSESLIHACFAMAGARVAVLIWYEMPRWRGVEAERSIDHVIAVSPVAVWRAAPNARVLALFRRAWPLGGSAVLDSLNTNIPRYFVAAIAGTAGLGAFAAMTTFSQATFLLVNSVAQMRLPALARAAASRQKFDFWRELRGQGLAGLVIGAGGIAVIWLGGGYILRIVFGESFLGELDAFIPIMLGGLGAVLALLATYALTALGDYRLQIFGYLACTIATILFCGSVARGSGLVEIALGVAKAQLIHVAIGGLLVLALARRRLT